MAKENWYESTFAKYIGIGVLVWGIGTGIGNLVGGILEGCNTQTQKKVYEMDYRYSQQEEQRFKLIDKHLEANKDRLSDEQLGGILKELAGER